MSAVLAACSEGDRSRTATEPLERLDPSSAALYPAQQKAQAKDFETTLVDGSRFVLSEQRGKVVILNIWATWCGPCHTETPDFVELYSEYRDRGLQILGVSIDTQGESVVQPFLDEYNVNYPIVIDDGSIMEKYGPTMGIPTTYVIDKAGDLRYFAVGPLTIPELGPRIEELLDE